MCVTKCGDIVLASGCILVCRQPPLPSPSPLFPCGDRISGPTVVPVNRQGKQKNHENHHSFGTAQPFETLHKNLNSRRKYTQYNNPDQTQKTRYYYSFKVNKLKSKFAFQIKIMLFILTLTSFYSS